MSWYGKRRVSYQIQHFVFQSTIYSCVGFGKPVLEKHSFLTAPSSARLHCGDKAAPHVTCQGVLLACAVLQHFIQGPLSWPTPTPICLLRPILFHCLLSRKRSKSQNSQFSLALASHLIVLFRQSSHLFPWTIYVWGLISETALQSYCHRRTTDIPFFAHFLQVSTCCGVFFLESFQCVNFFFTLRGSLDFPQCYWRLDSM